MQLLQNLNPRWKNSPCFRLLSFGKNWTAFWNAKKSTTNVAAGLALLDEFSGSVEREIDYKKNAKKAGISR